MQQKQQPQQATIIQTPTKLNQLTKQMVKPRIETNIKKVTPQQAQPQSHLAAAGNAINISANSSGSNANSNQPLKLLSSLTNMVNSSLIQSSSKITLKNSGASNSQVKTPNLNISMPTTCSSQIASGIQPLLFQLAKQQKGKGSTIKQSLTSAQLLELQKSYTQQLSAATAKNVSAAPTNIQMGNRSLSINTKIPIQTVSSSLASTSMKSAFATRGSAKIVTANTTLNNMTQMQINQLVQQGVCLLYTSPSPRDS